MNQHITVRKVLAAVAICGFTAAGAAATFAAAAPVTHAVVASGTSIPNGQPDPNG
jgi:hypothetical protein